MGQISKMWSDHRHEYVFVALNGDVSTNRKAEGRTYREVLDEAISEYP
jgi:hypothetical protein